MDRFIATKSTTLDSLRPGSARFEVVAAVLRNPKGVTREQLKDIVGVQASQAIAFTTKQKLVRVA